MAIFKRGEGFGLLLDDVPIQAAILSERFLCETLLQVGDTVFSMSETVFPVQKVSDFLLPVQRVNENELKGVRLYFQSQE